MSTSPSLPSVEIGTDIPLASGDSLRVYTDLGITVGLTNERSGTASFVGAPAGTGTLTVTSQSDRVQGNVRVGATIFSMGEYSIGVEYQGSISGNAQSHGGFLKGAIKS